MDYFIMDYSNFTKNPTLYSIDNDGTTTKIKTDNVQGILDYQQPSNIIIIGYGRQHLDATVRYSVDNYKTFKNWEDFSLWFNN